jgi:TrmH family RNA methyltransferase
VALRIVLVRPRYSGNIGSVLRVAANFAVPEVVLVAPACPPDDVEGVRMAMGSERLVGVRETANLDEAVADASLVVATTSLRHRDSRAVLDVEALASEVAAHPDAPVALVFGPERGGLARSEMRLAHLRVNIRTNPEFPVLNLAQAVAIVLAGLSAKTFPPPPAREPMDEAAPFGELDAAIGHLEEVMLASGFLDPANPQRVTDQFRRWFGRTIPSRREIALLHALAAHMQYLLGRGRGK